MTTSEAMQRLSRSTSKLGTKLESVKDATVQWCSEPMNLVTKVAPVAIAVGNVVFIAGVWMHSWPLILGSLAVGGAIGGACGAWFGKQAEKYAQEAAVNELVKSATPPSTEEDPDTLSQQMQALRNKLDNKE